MKGFVMPMTTATMAMSMRTMAMATIVITMAVVARGDGGSKCRGSHDDVSDQID